MFDLIEVLDRAEARSIARIKPLHSFEMQLAYESGVKIMRNNVADEILAALVEEKDSNDS